MVPASGRNPIMKIAIISPELLPVPAVSGGAVETLIELLIQNNEKMKRTDLDVYSVFEPLAARRALCLRNTQFYYTRVPHHLSRIIQLYNRFALKCRLTPIAAPYLRRVLKQIRSRRYDWIIIENRPLFLLAARRMLGKRARLALHLHNDTLSPDNWYARRVLSCCDRVIGVSAFIADRVGQVAKSGAEVQKTTVLYNRIDTLLFQPHARRPADAAAQTGIQILYYGRIVPRKGVLELINAFALALRVNPNLHLLLIGQSSDKDYQQKLQWARNALPSDRCTWIESVNHQQIPAYLDAADLVVLPSLGHEAFGLTIAESMCMEKAVIATASGGIPELIAGDCGLLVPTGPLMIKQLSEAILLLSENQELRSRLSRNARRKILEHFQSETYLEDLIAILQKN